MSTPQRLSGDANKGFASEAAKIGGYLECQRRTSAAGAVCGAHINIPEDQAEAQELVVGYMANGWPQHCGITMTWVSAYEAQHGPRAMREQQFDPNDPDNQPPPPEATI